MRREERHHLKDNALAAWLLRVRTTLGRNRRALIAAGWIAAAALVATGSGYGWQQWRVARASELLAAAMTVVDAAVVPPPEAPAPVEDEEGEGTPPAPPEPFVQPPGSYPSVAIKLEEAVPRLLAAADAYPNLTQGIAARYQAASALSVLGRSTEANAQYRQVADLAGDQVYGQMARLGLAETHLMDGAYADAIAILEAESGAESDLPQDAVLMRLGRAYGLAGQPSDARAAFARIVDEFPASPYAPEARRTIEELGATR
ncbi:MAG: tetratricopeptide repeat protein [Acidobacteria bacterium]|nr:tetratricopeptide repeat protein [Acidobacteriota bacterium]